MNAKHTPTPWIEQEMPPRCNDRITADDGEGTTICELPYGLDANTAFIVRACNTHDDLVAALKEAQDQILTNRACAGRKQSNERVNMTSAALLQIERALAKAGAA